MRILLQCPSDRPASWVKTMTVKKGVLVLAAGFSSRFGGSKLSAILADGSTVLQQTLQRISAASDNIVIISRQELLEEGILDSGICHAESARHSSSIDQPSAFRLFLCENSHLGMGSTLACGIRQISDWDACLVCLGDMPFIRTSTYQQLLADLRTDNIVIPEYHGKTGNPVGFGKKFFEQLLQLSGDTGGREIIQANLPQISRVKVSDAAILEDIDTPADLQRLQ
jgi:molybdenum cofactor cytidylyltransferase